MWRVFSRDGNRRDNDDKLSADGGHVQGEGGSYGGLYEWEAQDQREPGRCHAVGDSHGQNEVQTVR